MADVPTLTKADLPEIIRRYANGESLLDLGREAKKNKTTLYRWMLAGLGDKDFEDVVTNCLVNRVADADEMLEKAPDQCNVARAREIARFARMDLERRRPHLYGPKQEIKSESSLTIIIQRGVPEPPACTQIIEATAEAEPKE